MGPCLPAWLAHACRLFRTSDGTLWQSSYAPPTATEAAVKQKALADAQLALTTAQNEMTAARSTGKVLSTGIQVMNLTILPYAVMPNEMQARMSDLTDIRTFHPKNADPSSVTGVSDWWRSLW